MFIISIGDCPFNLKGYRDAECGWIPVQEEDHDFEKTNQSTLQTRRTALFLIIYAPRRGILEVRVH